MLEGYETVCHVDSVSVLFKKERGQYVGYFVGTRDNKYVMLPCDDEVYLTMHKVVSGLIKGFEELDKKEIE